MNKTEITSIKRRDFLRAAGLGGAAGAAAVVTGIGTAQAAAPELDQGGSGYRETAHVKTYYELAKF
jgi:DMSO/TMAO reductase YedYZ molybdopterin-dependent catalytic subunit